MRNLLFTLLVLLIPLLSHSQYWGNICFDVINLTSMPEQTIIPFCNDTANFDFHPGTPAGVSTNLYTDPYMDIDVGPFNFPCTSINYDIWGYIEYPLDGNGYMCLQILNGSCTSTSGPVNGNFGPLEGSQMMLWEGNTCDNAQLVFGTPCYWMTELVPGNIDSTEWAGVNDYDPTRQEWDIAIYDAIPGQTYLIQIDGFSWCVGCGEFAWCSEINLLSIEDPKPTIETIDGDDIRVKPPWRVTNMLGQEIEIQYNVPLIFYYKNGTTRMVVITE